MNQWQAVNSRPRDQETTGLDRDEDENAIALITGSEINFLIQAPTGDKV